MAFSSRLGSLLYRKNISHNISSSNGVPIMHMLNAVRNMSSTVFVGGLSWRVNDDTLKEAFSGFGDIIYARVIMDRDTGRSKGVGFVNFSTEDAAGSAVSAMSGKEIDGRPMRVSFADDRPPGSGFGSPGGYASRGGGGYGGGGYGGGGYGGGGGGYGDGGNGDGGGGYGDGGGGRGRGGYPRGGNDYEDEDGGGRP